MTKYIEGHSPTLIDYRNAYAYAEDVMKREACESNPDYTWVEGSVTSYPCPGLRCETGTCKFKDRDACLSMRETPYFDCRRKKVSCDTHPSGECEICEYGIKVGRKIVGPYTDDAPEGCDAGDYRYRDEVAHPVPHTTPPDSLSGFCDHDDQCREGYACVQAEPDAVLDKMGEPCESADDCGGGRSVCSDSGFCVADTFYEGRCVAPCTSDDQCENDMVCGTDPRDAVLFGRCHERAPAREDIHNICQPEPRNFTPYTITTKEGEKPVPCTFDEQCGVWGVGGSCGVDPDSPSYGFCYNDSTPPYLEWRDEIETWTGMPPQKNVCIQTMAIPRRWCEMPWTRAGTDRGPNGEDIPLDKRVKLSWKARARPPFWYDERDGTCHVTKSYCSKNLKNGGMSAGYGRSRDYWLGSVCSGDTKKEVVGAYDCCMELGDNVASFFLGRTLTTDFRELFEGDMEGFGERWEDYYRRTGSGIADLVSDPRLKQGIVCIARHVAARDVHGYEWEWTGRATQLYGLRGRARGLLTTEVKQKWPHMVHTDSNGYEHIHVGRDDEDLFNVYSYLNAL